MKKVKIIIICLIALVVIGGLPIRGGDMTSEQSNKVDNWLKNLDI